MAEWSFLTNHARALLYIAGEPDARLIDIGAAIDVTERTAFGIVSELIEAGYIEKHKEGRRNRYQIHEDLPLVDPVVAERPIGEILNLLVEARRHDVTDQ